MATSGEFSPDNCRQFAHVSPGGVLKIWDTATGKLKQEYAPSSHLTATCCCIAWAPNMRATNTAARDASPSKKKRKSTVTHAVESLELIAMGTMSGSLMLYSIAQAELNTQMHEGHTGRVTGICWSADSESLYSCSVDNHIIEWDVATASVRHKWKGEKGKGMELHSIQICHTQRHLLTAGLSIKLWDLETRKVLQTFAGHTSEVFRLYQVPSSASHSSSSTVQINGDTDLSSHDKSIENSYVISAAVADAKINVWQICTTKQLDEGKQLIASFSMSEAAMHVQIRPPSADSQLFQLVAVTIKGKLVLFEHVLNGRQTKALSPKCVVELATSGDVPRPLSIASAATTTDADKGVVIVYEDFLRPVFEKLSRQEFQKKSVRLVREDPAKSSAVAVQENVSKVKAPRISKDVTVLAPGYMAPSGPVRAEGDEVPTKKKRRKSTDMSIEERLNAIEESTPAATRGDGKIPKTDNLMCLLDQGLHSQDKTLLNNVLQRTDPVLIRNTVSRLSPSVVVLLIKELAKRIQGHAQSQRTVLRWFNAVIAQHKSFLTSLPDVDELLLPLRQTMYTPPDLLPYLLQVNTQLKSFLTQGNAAAQGVEAVASQPAVLVYQEESSDDEMALDEFNHEAVISEDEWDIDESEDSDDSEAEDKDNNNPNSD